MHNMIIEDEHGMTLDWKIPEEHGRPDFTFRDLQLGTQQLESVEAHFKLHNDLIQHLWILKGHEQRS